MIWISSDITAFFFLKIEDTVLSTAFNTIPSLAFPMHRNNSVVLGAVPSVRFDYQAVRSLVYSFIPADFPGAWELLYTIPRQLLCGKADRNKARSDFKVIKWVFFCSAVLIDSFVLLWFLSSSVLWLMPGKQIESSIWEKPGDLQSVFKFPLLPRNYGKTSCCYLNRSCVPGSLWEGKRPPDISYAGAEKAPFVAEENVWMCGWEGCMWVWECMRNPVQ